MSEFRSKPKTEPEPELVMMVSQKGQATIPKKFREEHGIDAPGRVRMRSTDDGILIERVPTPAESTGELAGETDSQGRTPTERLRDERQADAEAEER